MGGIDRKFYVNIQFKRKQVICPILVVSKQKYISTSLNK